MLEGLTVALILKVLFLGLVGSFLTLFFVYLLVSMVMTAYYTCKIVYLTKLSGMQTETFKSILTPEKKEGSKNGNSIKLN